MRFLTWLLTNAIALAVAAWLIDGIRFTGTDDTSEKILPLLVVALILGAVSSFVKPVLQILSIPFIIVTLGLFLLVINALMPMLTGWVADTIGVDFEVTGFWPGGRRRDRDHRRHLGGRQPDRARRRSDEPAPDAADAPTPRPLLRRAWSASATSAAPRWPTSSSPRGSRRPGSPDGWPSSASGTGDWHVGNPMDARAAATLTAAGRPLAHRARHWSTTPGSGSIDLVLAMDGSNLADVGGAGEQDGCSATSIRSNRVARCRTRTAVGTTASRRC